MKKEKRALEWLKCPRFFSTDRPWGGWGLDRKADLLEIRDWVRKLVECNVSVLRFGTYWGGEAYYQSKVAPMWPGLGDRDPAREAVDECRKLGIKFIAYMNPNFFPTSNPHFPEWAARDTEGNPVPTKFPGLYFTCINTAYWDYFLNIIEEVFAEYKPDGLYLDNLTTRTCHCEACQERYQKDTGLEIPEEIVNQLCRRQVLGEMSSDHEIYGEPNDTRMVTYSHWLFKRLAEATRDVTTLVKNLAPKAICGYHSQPKPDTVDYYDLTLSEIYVHNPPWNYFVWQQGEFAANAASAHPVPVIHNPTGAKWGTDALQFRHLVWQTVANGCFFNAWSMVGIKEPYAFLKENSEYYDLLETDPVKFLALVRPGVAIHSATDRYISSQTSVERENEWSPPNVDRFLSAPIGFYAALLHSQIPIVSVHKNKMVEMLEGFKVLCLPNELCMGADRIRAVKEFVRNGGGLIATHETSLYNEGARKLADFGFAELFGVRYLKSKIFLPLKIFGETLDEHAILTAKNDRQSRVPRIPSTRIVFTEDHPVTSGLTGLAIPNHECHVLAELTGRAEALAVLESTGCQHPAVVVNNYGKGRVVYIAGRLDSTYSYWMYPEIRRLFANAVRWVSGNRLPVEVKEPADIGVTLFQQPGRRILHAVNYTTGFRRPIESFDSVSNIDFRVEVAPGRSTKCVRTLMGKEDLEFKESEGYLQFVVPQIREYEVAVMDYK